MSFIYAENDYRTVNDFKVVLSGASMVRQWCSVVRQWCVSGAQWCVSGAQWCVNYNQYKIFNFVKNKLNKYRYRFFITKIRK